MDKRVQKLQRAVRDEALSGVTAKAIAMEAWLNGRVRWTPHFVQRGRERGFDNLDVENVIRLGFVHSPPEFSARFRNWVYLVERTIPGEAATLGINFAIDLRAYCNEEPLIVLITGRWLSVN